MDTRLSSDPVSISRTVVAADASHAANPPDGLDEYYAALGELAGTPSHTTADIRAKAAALRTCFVGGSVEGDMGLALSLVQDLLRLL